VVKFVFSHSKLSKEINSKLSPHGLAEQQHNRRNTRPGQLGPIVCKTKVLRGITFLQFLSKRPTLVFCANVFASACVLTGNARLLLCNRTLQF